MNLPKKHGRGSRSRARDAKVSRRLRPSVQELEARDLKTVTVAVEPAFSYPSDYAPKIVVTGDSVANDVAVWINNNGTPGLILDDEVWIAIKNQSSPIPGVPSLPEFHWFPQYNGYGYHHDPNTLQYEFGPVEAYSFVEFRGYGGDDRFENVGDMGCDVYGGAGNDTIFAGLGRNYLYGGKGNDVIQGNDAGDYIVGGAGDDKIWAWGGDDKVDGDDLGAVGNDTIYLGEGNDEASGGEGNDLIFGNNGDDTVYGNEGDDTIYLGAGSDHGYGGADDDFIHAGYGSDGSVDYVDGGADRNTLYVKKKDTYKNGYQVHILPY